MSFWLYYVQHRHVDTCEIAYMVFATLQTDIMCVFNVIQVTKSSTFQQHITEF